MPPKIVNILEMAHISTLQSEKEICEKALKWLVWYKTQIKKGAHLEGPKEANTTIHVWLRNH